MLPRSKFRFDPAKFRNRA